MGIAPGRELSIYSPGGLLQPMTRRIRTSLALLCLVGFSLGLALAGCARGGNSTEYVTEVLARKEAARQGIPAPGSVDKDRARNSTRIYTLEDMPANATRFRDHVIDFDEAVHLALIQSPYLKTSALNISQQRLQEISSYFDFFPDFYIQTKMYYQEYEELEGKTDPLSFAIKMTPFDPLKAYFTMQMRMAYRDMAVLQHKAVIADALRELAKAYLQLEALERIAPLLEELRTLSEQINKYSRLVLEQGEISALDHRINQTQAEQIRYEVLETEILVRQLTQGVYRLLGIDGRNAPILDMDDVRAQVLGSFSPFRTSPDQVLATGLQARLLEMQRFLAQNNVKARVAAFFPKFQLKVETSTSNNRSGERVYILSDIPLFDWGERFRDVEIAQIGVEIAENEIGVELSNLLDDYHALLDEYELAGAELRLARSKAEVAGLTRRKFEMMYNSGKVEYEVVLDKSIISLKTRITAIEKEFEYDSIALDIRHASGDLFRSYVETETP